ncbi:MAG: tripartite tricarboxylate transporter substrate binding protein [Alphaproteobacteria bacterium]|nr:tripartite tricarboxylate transporter substrate binding protein [Alphaproteobacteria bacterium]
MQIVKALMGAIVLASFGFMPQSGPAAAQAQAPAWPQRTVKFILTLGPGSGADIGARLISEKLTAKWGQSVVVENRPGGDGFVAINAFAGARDDHTLLFGPASSFTAHPYLHAKLPYDPRDLSPVARVSATLISIGVPPSMNVGSLKELFDRVRKEPGKYNWATVTGATDLVLAAFLKSSGLSMAKIPYRDTVQAINDVFEGRLHLYWAAHAIVRGAIQAGRIKGLAITASEPTAVIPGVPTVAQAGFPQLTFDGLVGIFGTRDMPAALRERIASDVKEVLSDPVIVSRLQATGQVVIPGSAAEFAASIDKQRATVAEIAKVLGIKAATN